ncbi:ABC transporter permease [Nonomuraea aurantiaca]|uniref:ABC transporter permease n=1 Tax=Nonomuraea aurantiaca TaxID=2878562 RepID=UPI001CD923D1|nr:ABC transporter permease [Nonomuraea aurantiaca]MCA2224046.1 ABC transporter permease [Nonomuraea aurantiaca]
MTNDFRNVVAAELIKLRTLPATLITIAVTVAGATTLAVTFAGGRHQLGGSASSAEAALRVVEYGQIGFILLGILAFATEYGGSQIRATLTAVPGRTLLMAGKAAAYVLIAAPTALLTLALSLLGARLVPGMSWTGEHVGALVGAGAYLVLVGLLGYAVAALVRDLIAALVATLALVLVLPPVLAGVTTLTRYLPSHAGTRMYELAPALPEDLTPVQGAVTLTAWLVLALVTGVALFAKRDA